MNKNLIIVIVIVLILGIGGLVLRGRGNELPVSVGTSQTQEETSLPSAQVSGNFVKGRVAPDVSLSDFEGNTHNLADYRGKAVVLDYWASWCPPCRAEMPVLQDAHERYGDELVIIGVHRTDTESKSAGERFASSVGVTYLLVLDPDDSLYRAATAASFAGMPVAVFIDREGVVQEVKVGAKTENEINQKISELVN